MYRSVRIVRQLEQVFGTYRMMLKDLEEIKNQLPSKCFYKGKKNARNTQTLFVGGGGGS
jgi:hypothetical protein